MKTQGRILRVASLGPGKAGGPVPSELRARGLEQQSAAAFLAAAALPAGGSIGISVTSGAAIFYGATVDNRTGDPNL
jgi:hypothetical protein